MPLLFINWLIIKAAKRDGDPVPAGVVDPKKHPKARAFIQGPDKAAGKRGFVQVPQLPSGQRNAPRPRCRGTGRFIPATFAQAGIFFEGPTALQMFMGRQGLRT